MDYKISKEKLSLKLIRDYNLLTARKVEELAQQMKEISIDLSQAKIVDSEGVISLYKLIKAGKRIELIHPPEILFDVIKILGLEGSMKFEKITPRA